MISDRTVSRLESILVIVSAGIVVTGTAVAIFAVIARVPSICVLSISIFQLVLAAVIKIDAALSPIRGEILAIFSSCADAFAIKRAGPANFIGRRW